MVGICSFVAFTTPYCGGCKPVRELLQKSPVRGEFIDASSEDGSERAVSLGVLSVPTVIFFDENNSEVGRANDVHAVRELICDH